MVRNTVIFHLGVPLAAAFVVCALLLGCGGREKESRYFNVEEKHVELFYDFKGEDKSGKPCETGEKTFQVKHEMCIALQDEGINNYCASEQRQAKFINDCGGGKKDGFFIAKACHIEILNRESGESLYKADICAGRKKDRGLRLMDRANYSRNGVRLNLALQMATPGKPLDGHKLSRKFHVPGTNADSSLLLSPLDEYHGKTDTKIQLIVDCVSVWACEK